MKKRCPNRDAVLTTAAKKMAALRAENAELINCHDKMARRLADHEKWLREANDRLEAAETRAIMAEAYAKRLVAERDDEKTKARVLSSFAHHLADELRGRNDG